MAELRILTVGDIHLSDQAPGKRGETYGEDILAKVEECVSLVRSENATHLLLLGDVFDNKSAHRISHKLVQRIGTILTGVDVPVYILVGNHDLAPGGLLHSLAKQPLGTVGMLPGITLLTHEPLVLDGDVGLFPVPGVPLDENWRDEFVTKNKIPDGLTRRIVVAHQLIVPDVTHFPEAARRNFYDAAEVAEATDAELVLYGDIHTKHETYKKHDVLFANFGSICRMSVSDVEHVPEVVMYVIADNKARNVSIKRFVLQSVKPADDVFLLEQHVEAKAYREDIDNAVARIKTTRVHKFSLDSVIEEIRDNDTAEEETRSKAIELLEAVR